MLRAVRNTSLLLLCLLITLLPVSAVCEADSIDELQFVNDLAGILSEETEARLTERCLALQQSCGGEAVVLTVSGLGGTQIDEYAYGFFERWGLGDAERNNGFLLLISMSEDDYWALQGAGLVNELTSGEIGDLMDDLLEPYYAAGDYDTGVTLFMEAVCDRIDEICSPGRSGGNSGQTTAGGGSQSSASDRETDPGQESRDFRWAFISTFLSFTPLCVFVPIVSFLRSISAGLDTVLGFFVFLLIVWLFLRAVFDAFGGCGCGGCLFPPFGGGGPGVPPRGGRYRGGYYGGGHHTGGHYGGGHHGGGHSYGGGHSSGHVGGGGHSAGHVGGGGHSRGGGAGRGRR